MDKGITVLDYFRAITKMITIGKGGQRKDIVEFIEDEEVSEP